MATHDTGSHAAGEKRGGSLLWLWLLLGALALALAIWGIVELLDDDEEATDVSAVPVEEVEETVEEVELTEVTPADPTVTVEDTATETAVATDTATETVAPTADPVPVAGAVLVGGVDVLTASSEELAPLVGEQVTAESVQVVELVADEAFYVGPGVGETVLVRLVDFAGTDGAESPFQVEEGSDVNITGTLQRLDPAVLDSLLLYNPAEELEPGDFYVQVEEISGVR